MADLKESLSQRERRSRTVAFVVGIAIILVLIFLIVQINDDNSATDDQNGEATTEQVEEGAESGATNEGESGADQSTTEEADTSADASGESGDATNQGDSEEVAVDELPATGPKEALIGMAVVSLAAVGYFKSRNQLKTSKLD